MRHTGRTTKMLVSIANWLCDNFGKQKSMLLITHRIAYSLDLILRLSPLLDLECVNKYVFRHGNTLIYLSSYDIMQMDPGQYRDISDVKIFADHYTGSRGYYIQL